MGTGANRGNGEGILYPLLFHVLIWRPMHPLFPKASALTETVIAAAIEVHRDKGLLDVPVGLLINFHEMRVTEGISG